MEEHRVIIPEESYAVAKFRQKELPGVAVINESLRDFEPKIVFALHLSVMIHFDDLIENGMPSQAERDLVDPFCDELEVRIRGPNAQKPNALFLARITWNATRELIWRVYEPEPADTCLKSIIAAKSHPRFFDYIMEHDPEWEKTTWHLQSCN